MHIVKIHQQRCQMKCENAPQISSNLDFDKRKYHKDQSKQTCNPFLNEAKGL